MMELLIPLVAGLALIWLIGRGVPWNAKLMTIVVTLAVIVLILLLERGGYWPEEFRRQ
jgi:amino acid transporter